MFDSAQSNDPIKVPSIEPVKLGEATQVEVVEVADIEKIATSLEIDAEKIAANSSDETNKVVEVTSPVINTPVSIGTNLKKGEQAVPQGIDPNKNYSNIVEVLKDQGALSQDEANQVLVANISTGKSYATVLEENKFVKEEDLVRAKSVVHKIPFIKISESGTDPQALTQIPEGVARNYEMLPILFDKEKNTLVVAMKNPLDLSAIDFAEQKSGLKIITKYAMPSELDRKIAENYSQSLSSEVTAALEQTSQVVEDRQKKQNLTALSGETIRQAPITKIVQTIVSFAMKARASDIHIEPQENRTRVRYRIDGILVEKLILPKSVHEAVISRIKILSGLKIDEKRIPQDGRFNFISGSQEVDLRVSTLPTVNGEKIVMRLLKKDATVPGLEELGLNGVALRHVKDAIKVPHGIILVTGPTGSGKTTTLYSILHTINTPKVNIITLEDPVEYQMASVNQVQINQQAGLTFSSGLRSFLRQDPNIIMVGEVRDSETADLAVQASLTGHLVFSTLHTSSAAGAIPRLLDMGVEPFLLASSLTLTMAQRVVRKINPAFKEEYKPEKAVLDDIKEVLGSRLDEWLRKSNAKEENIMLFRAKEDRPQTEPEYKGRVAIFEVMPLSEGISKLILERKPASEMEKMALNDGMLLMKQDGYLKALDGITTIEEVLRVAQI
ncbi:MAG: type II/IV secretion system protein [Thermoprotei archaeon]|nr:MAG: type II/IV secretion system protein [Thermoprotei archaeon]